MPKRAKIIFSVVPLVNVIKLIWKMPKKMTVSSLEFQEMIKSTAMSQSWTSSTRFLSLFFVRKRAKITELKHAVQPKWLDICKNVINTIHWQYKNAEFEKKNFLNSSKFAPVHSKNWISRRGSKRGWPPLPEPQFFGQFTP